MAAVGWECWSQNTTKARKSGNVDARRLENACWRLLHMEKQQAQSPEGSPKKSMSSGNLSGINKVVSSSSLSGLIGGNEDESSNHEELHEVFLERLQDTLAKGELRFPARRASVRYDDLPTFPIRPNFADFKNKLRPASECVVFDGCPEDPYHPSNTPIYQTATFVQPSCSEFGAYDYTRSGNPTRTALEKQVAMLDQAAVAFAFASGMAALHTVMRLLRCGDQIIVNEDIYGGMHRLLTQDCIFSGIDVVFVDTTDVASVEQHITERTRLIHTESPSNPRMRITDLRRLADVAHRHGVLLCVDSTMMPPVICKPLTLGADIVVHSATKFFSGHADCTGGLVCVRDPDLAHRVGFLQNAEGTALAPFECFLFLRGIKTMHLRVERAQENAEVVAAFLLRQPCIEGVFFPGRGGTDANSLKVHLSQATGQGSMISLTTGSVEFSRRFCDACRIFKTTVSFGSVNSLIEMPCTMSHASIPSEKRTLPPDLIRLSIGIEDVRDLIADLSQALDVAAGTTKAEPVRLGEFDSWFEDLPVVPNPHLADFPSTLTGASTKAPSTDSSRVSQRRETAELESSSEAADMEEEKAVAGVALPGGFGAAGPITLTVGLGAVVVGTVWATMRRGGSR
mmetsp:Transcript_94290/g.202397  ORF Transcript_94290/g.202397 Transcript_94290/m.202397 type:complete len:626 (-) Transcript_94290:175-2052(-)